MWRMIHNSLALRKELVRRGMELDTKCVMCNRLDEDGAHLFFNRKWAVKVWGAMGMEQHRCVLEKKSSASEAMKYYILALEEREQMVIVTFLWMWWLERNRVREGEKRKGAENVAFMCQQYAGEYLNLCKQSVEPVREVMHTWKRPEQFWVKINSDGAFSERTGEGGWGLIITDEGGEVVEAAAGKLTRVLDAYQAEVEACLAGVTLAGEMGVERAIVETDSLVLKQALKNSTHRLASTGCMICEIQGLLATSFRSCITRLHMP